MPQAEGYDPRYRPFFAGLAEGRLLIPRCTECGRVDWYPTGRCRHCGKPDPAWAEVVETPRLYSFTRVAHAFTPADRNRVPYLVALVSFDGLDGVRLVAGLDVGAGPDGDAPPDLDCELEPLFSARGGPLPAFPVMRVVRR